MNTEVEPALGAKRKNMEVRGEKKNTWVLYVVIWYCAPHVWQMCSISARGAKTLFPLITQQIGPFCRSRVQHSRSVVRRSLCFSPHSRLHFQPCCALLCFLALSIRDSPPILSTFFAVQLLFPQGCWLLTRALFVGIRWRQRPMCPSRWWWWFLRGKSLRPNSFEAFYIR